MADKNHTGARSTTIRADARILIDGRSGAGKSLLARALVGLHPEIQLVRLDDLYPGWDGLDAGSAAVPNILTTFRWRAWDWAGSRPGGWTTLDPCRPILVEGVGALSRMSAPRANLAVWIELDMHRRRARALERDGGAYAPFWNRWSVQEENFIAREDPKARADLEIAGDDVVRAMPSILGLLNGSDERTT